MNHSVFSSIRLLHPDMPGEIVGQAGAKRLDSGREQRSRCLPMTLTLAGMILWQGCASAPRSWAHRKFDEYRAATTNVTILPWNAAALRERQRTHNLVLALLPLPGGGLVTPQKVETIELKSADVIRDRLESLIRAEFQARGFAVNRSRLREEFPGYGLAEPAMNLEFTKDARSDGSILTHLNRAYEGLDGHAIRPEGKALADYEGAAGLVFTTFRFVEESTGQQVLEKASAVQGVMGVLTGNVGLYGDMLPEGAHLRIVLVHGRDGTVLWRQETSFKALNERALETAVADAFHDFPKITASSMTESARRSRR